MHVEMPNMIYPNGEVIYGFEKVACTILRITYEASNSQPVKTTVS